MVTNYFDEILTKEVAKILQLKIFLKNDGSLQK